MIPEHTNKMVTDLQRDIMARLDNHGIEYRWHEGRLLALNVWTQEGRVFSDWLDVTDYGLFNLNIWLGY